ncbi:CpaD family pilus assembly protein [Novosphingobium sp.]|uniref:CpaD family pilus assembly protein n=1 Tax=Novosphingobium sp. TaxID=1874826 RepID=UPI001DD361AE|nr:CpaD family pilus assembly protein [Novosphingobium sp.]MBX9665533.1 CpaD family pilus assembly protein [Novosphingobium sp.]
MSIHLPRIARPTKGAFRVVLLAGVLSLPLAACNAPSADMNRSLESVHQPVVQRTSYVFDVSTLPGGGLPVSEQRRLAGWLDALGLGYGDRVSLDDPVDSDQTRNSVEQVAGRFGILLADVAPVTEGTIAPGTARIVVSRSEASVPGCPDWASKIDNRTNNATSSNYGCAVNSNMAAMVANKDDLVRGAKGQSTTLVQSNTKAIQSYREQPPTGAQGLRAVSSKSGGN